MSEVQKDVNTLKEKGNSCLHEGKNEEAILHYTHAIKMDSKNYTLFSNRSYAFLKMQQYYLALEDAKETIRLKPDWAKGYFRKAEVEFQTFNFSDALLSYKMASGLQPNDSNLKEAIERTKAAVRKEKENDDQVPWIGAAIGIFVAALIVVADQIFTHRPVLENPMLMLIITVAIAVLGYKIANASRHYIKTQRTALLEPPINLFQEDDKEQKSRTKYSKAQARQRFKKGRV